MICNNRVADGICDSSVVDANSDSIKYVRSLNIFSRVILLKSFLIVLSSQKTPKKHNIPIYKQPRMKLCVREGDNFPFISFKKLMIVFDNLMILNLPLFI